MHKIFGNKQTVQYLDREGAYLIPYQDGKVAVVQTPKGYFLLGGGLQQDESHVDCICRECLEEIGYTVCVHDTLCSAETYTKHPTLGYFHPTQTYYFGQLIEKVSTPTEKDHLLRWFEYHELKGKLFVEMQNWALEQLSTILFKEST